MTNQIINFIEGIRMGHHAEHGDIDRRPVVNNNNPTSTVTSVQQPIQESEEEQARRLASHYVVEAEQFRANINEPPGTSQGHMENKIWCDLVGPTRTNHMSTDFSQNLDVDDRFFHVTCHIDDGLKAKIESGEYVDLEKLLLKVRARNENKLDLVYKDGHSYFIPAPSESKINGIRKLEQAFRVYAAIYSQANPQRAAEIWQYVHVINTAASSFVWDNVASYDFTFRQLMHRNPGRNWAKIYQQMWSISMRDSIVKGFGNSNNNNYQQG